MIEMNIHAVINIAINTLDKFVDSSTASDVKFLDNEEGIRMNSSKNKTDKRSKETSNSLNTNRLICNKNKKDHLAC